MNKNFRMPCDVCDTQITYEHQDENGFVVCPKCGSKYEYNEGMMILLTDEQKKKLQSAEHPMHAAWIQLYLDCSTKHISLDDSKLLHTGPEKLTIRDDEYGWFINVPIEDSDDDFEDWLIELGEAGFSTPFRLLLRFARKHSCNWINLDQDGEEIPDLPTLDW